MSLVDVLVGRRTGDAPVSPGEHERPNLFDPGVSRAAGRKNQLADDGKRHLSAVWRGRGIRTKYGAGQNRARRAEAPT
jgi:hypothetical protein